MFHLVFYDGQVVNPEGFMAVMKKPANVPVFFFRDTEPLGVAWLNGLSGGIAFAHFCGLKAALGSTQKIGRLALNYWMSFARTDGGPLLSVILGITPDNNRLAVSFIRRIGFHPLGVIPGILWDAYAAERVGALVSYYARQ